MRIFSDSVALAAQLESGGADPSHRALGGRKGGKDSALSRLVEFTQRVLPLCEHSLSQNETLNIYHNELGGDGGGGGGGDEDSGKMLREERQFMDLDLSQGKGLPAAEWHPVNGTWLCVAAVPRLTVEQRVAESSMPRVSHVLFYTLGEFVAQIVLELPADVTCMSWNAKNTNLLAVGCLSGQVCVFDLTAANATLAAAASGGGKKSAGGEARAPRVQPKAVSALEAGHSKPVVALRWSPQSHHVTNRGVFAEDRDGSAPSQFMSIAGDGMVAVWDIRFRERELARLGAKAGGAKKAPAKGKDGKPLAQDDGPPMLETALVPGAVAVPEPPVDIPWQPTYKVVLRLGMTPFAVCSVSLPPEERPADPILMCSEGGLLAAADWAPPGEGTHRDVWAGMDAGGGGGKKKGDDDDDKAPSGGAAGGSRMLWVSGEADRPAVALRRHPLAKNVFLVVTDFSFSLWRAGTPQPLFTSAPCAAVYTCAHWSPTRAAVIMLGRADGVVDVWDLLDATDKPVSSFTLVSVPLTSLNFRTKYNVTAGQKDKQLVAVGDAKGSLHILAVPFALRKGSKDECAHLEAFLDREGERAAYCLGRAAVQDAEKAKKAARATLLATQREAQAQKADSELQAAKAALREKHPAEAARLTHEALEARKQAAARAAAEVAFRALQDAVMNELGVKEDDIVPLAGKLGADTPSNVSSATASRKPSNTPADAEAAKAAAIAAQAKPTSPKGGKPPSSMGAKPSSKAGSKR